MEREIPRIRTRHLGDGTSFISVEPVRGGWESSVMVATSATALQCVQDYQRNFGRMPNIGFTGLGQRSRTALNDIYQVELRQQDFPLDTVIPPDSFLRLKSATFKPIAEDIRKRKDYASLYEMFTGVSTSQLPEKIKLLLTVDIAALYLLVGGSNHYLVGIKDGPVWRPVKPSVQEGREKTIRLLDMAIINLGNLSAIGRKEAISVPEDPIDKESLEGVRIPTPIRSIEDHLEEAYYHQRYVVPPEGAEIRFRKAGDLEKIILVQTKDKLFARAITQYGEVFVTLDLETAQPFTSIDAYHENKVAWANIVAETYHDLVTAIEAPMTRFKNLRKRQTKTLVEGKPEEIEESPQVIYIPRKVRIGNPEPRIPYDGPPRPVKPHPVTGYKRKGNMTAKQEKNIREFEQLHDLKILDRIPAGYTWARPYFVPEGSASSIKGLPTFIKRRIETQITQQRVA